MRYMQASCAVLALAIVAASAPVGAQQSAQRVDLGKREFDNNCAVCHGRDGKGGGPYVDLLKRGPPDLTLMARNNSGVFPLARVYDAIEGAGPGHGGREMPIWGQDYSTKAAEYYVDVPYDSQAFVRARILALAEYLSRLQAK